MRRSPSLHLPSLTVLPRITGPAQVVPVPSAATLCFPVLFVVAQFVATPFVLARPTLAPFVLVPPAVMFCVLNRSSKPSHICPYSNCSHAVCPHTVRRCTVRRRAVRVSFPGRLSPCCSLSHCSLSHRFSLHGLHLLRSSLCCSPSCCAYSTAAPSFMRCVYSFWWSMPVHGLDKYNSSRYQYLHHVYKRKQKRTN